MLHDSERSSICQMLLIYVNLMHAISSKFIFSRKKTTVSAVFKNVYNYLFYSSMPV